MFLMSEVPLCSWLWGTHKSVSGLYTEDAGHVGVETSKQLQGLDT